MLDEATTPLEQAKARFNKWKRRAINYKESESGNVEEVQQKMYEVNNNRRSMAKQNKVITSSEPDSCTYCKIQFQNGDRIYFDKGPFTFVVGTTHRNRYVIHKGVEITHAEPTCQEVLQKFHIEQERAFKEIVYPLEEELLSR